MLFLFFLLRLNIFLKEIFFKRTFGPMTNVLGIKKVYELPNPKSLLYSHDSEPLRMLKTDLIVRKEN